MVGEHTLIYELKWARSATFYHMTKILAASCVENEILQELVHCEVWYNLLSAICSMVKFCWVVGCRILYTIFNFITFLRTMTHLPFYFSKGC